MSEKQPDKKRNGAGKPPKRSPGKPVSKRPNKNRLGPGELDKLVLAHMRQRKGEAPHTASAIGKTIERSSGAVANCLVRLEKQEKVRLVKPKPRSYALAEAKRR